MHSVAILEFRSGVKIEVLAELVSSAGLGEESVPCLSRAQLFWHLNFRLLAFKIMGQQTSFILSRLVSDNLLQHP